MRSGERRPGHRHVDSVLFVGPLERVLLLRTLPILDGLGPVQLAAIAQHAQERFFEPHALLRTPEQAAGAIYLIVQGEVEVKREDGGVRKLGPGDAVGFVEMLSRTRRSLEARAVVHTIVLELDWDAQLDVCEEHFPVVMQYIGYLAGRTIEALRKQLGAAANPPLASKSKGFKGNLNLVERVLVLSRSRDLSTGSLDALAELAHHVLDAQWAAGEPIWALDEPAAHFMLLTRGAVQCTTRSGEAFAYQTGEAVGMHEALQQSRRWYAAQSKTKTAALRIDLEPFVDILEDHFDLSLDFMAVLAANLIRLERAEPGEARS